MLYLTKADEGLISEETYKEIQEFCKSEQIWKLRLLGIPFNDMPKSQNETYLYDEGGLLRNSGNAKHELG